MALTSNAVARMPARGACRTEISGQHLKEFFKESHCRPTTKEIRISYTWDLADIEGQSLTGLEVIPQKSLAGHFRRLVPKTLFQLQTEMQKQPHSYCFVVYSRKPTETFVHTLHKTSNINAIHFLQTGLIFLGFHIFKQVVQEESLRLGADCESHCTDGRQTNSGLAL